MERKSEDECLILMNDMLWDVVMNDMTYGVARIYLCTGRSSSTTTKSGAFESFDKQC
ncbi:hypothetical protein E1A91_D02G088500v1 [Gossypium mustelinum]|uniref:PPM-type phosphatase domain-containing protein n=1 Tax=Gossypium mustelinum TaxID=34275 RepID=A0A5D2VUR2_GOSMU|nr:hypothetical protein E1A91_D02G088500v1 [Gossypium mustelinum]